MSTTLRPFPNSGSTFPATTTELADFAEGVLGFRPEPDAILDFVATCRACELTEAGEGLVGLIRRGVPPLDDTGVSEWLSDCVATIELSDMTEWVEDFWRE